MNPVDVKAYTQRDWDLVHRLKEQFWAERKRLLTPAQALRIGDDLRRHAVNLREGWPSDQERQEDLKAHLKVTRSLRRVAPHRGH